MQFVRVDAVPAKFAVTTEILKKYLRPGKTLEEEAKNKRVVRCDEVVTSSERCSGWWITKYSRALNSWMENSFQLLWSSSIWMLTTNSFQLPFKFTKHPIQTGIQVSGDNPPLTFSVYTPDDGAAWLLAKICVGTADFGYFQAACHFGKTHFFTEPLIVATNRILALNHPVHMLIKPHTKYHLGKAPMMCFGQLIFWRNKLSGKRELI